MENAFCAGQLMEKIKICILCTSNMNLGLLFSDLFAKLIDRNWNRIISAFIRRRKSEKVISEANWYTHSCARHGWDVKRKRKRLRIGFNFIKIIHSSMRMTHMISNLSRVTRFSLTWVEIDNIAMRERVWIRLHQFLWIYQSHRRQPYNNRNPHMFIDRQCIHVCAHKMSNKMQQTGQWNIHIQHTWLWRLHLQRNRVIIPVGWQFGFVFFFLSFVCLFINSIASLCTSLTLFHPCLLCVKLCLCCVNKTARMQSNAKRVDNSSL